MEDTKKQGYVDKLIEHLNTKWKDSACPMCKKKQGWNVSGIFELREYHDGDLVLGGGRIMPLMPVTCKNCAHTIFVNALLAGIIAPQNKNTDSNKKEDNQEVSEEEGKEGKKK